MIVEEAQGALVNCPMQAVYETTEFHQRAHGLVQPLLSQNSNQLGFWANNVSLVPSQKGESPTLGALFHMDS